MTATGRGSSSSVICSHWTWKKGWKHRSAGDTALVTREEEQERNSQNPASLPQDKLESESWGVTGEKWCVIILHRRRIWGWVPVQPLQEPRDSMTYVHYLIRGLAKGRVCHVNDRREYRGRWIPAPVASTRAGESWVPVMSQPGIQFPSLKGLYSGPYLRSQPCLSSWEEMPENLSIVSFFFKKRREKSNLLWSSIYIKRKILVSL